MFIDSNSSREFFGQGQLATFGSGDGTYTASYDGNAVAATFSGDYGWQFVFAAPPGQPLTPGTYASAVYPTAQTTGVPGISISNNGRVCTATTGTFTVEDATYGTGSAVASFAVSFYVSCASFPGMYGELRVTSTVPFTAVGIPQYVPDVPVMFPSTSQGYVSSPVAITISNTGSQSLTVSAASTFGDFSITSDACLAGPISSGASCEIDVAFAPKTYGMDNGGLYLTDSTARGSHHLNLTGSGVAPGQISISKAGSGSGLVTSSPSGIDCGSTCLGTWNAGTQLTLTASPAPGSTFVSWSDVCKSTTATCLIDAAAGLTNITATFAALPSSPTITTGGSELQSSGGFEGSSDSSLVCASHPCLEPPDPWVAVGPADVVQATNLEIRMSSRSGTILADVALPDFFAEPAGQTIDGDPRVVWDAVEGRWLASELSADCSSGHLYVAISDTADPTGWWTSYRYDTPGVFPDYPGLGYSQDKVALGYNAFTLTSCNAGAFQDGAMAIFDMSALYTAAPSIAVTSFGLGTFDIRPSGLLTSGADIPVVATDGSGDVWTYRVVGTNSGGDAGITGLTDFTATGAAAPFADPPMPAGFSTATAPPLDGRPTDALAQNGNLWTVAGYPCVPNGDVTVRNCVRVLEFTSNGSTVRQDFAIGVAGSDVFGGGIGLTGNGSLAVVYSQADGSGLISTNAAWQAASDSVDSLRGPSELQVSAGVYAGTRWGDYVGVASDPNDPASVWQGDETATANGGWTTWVSRLTTAETGGLSGSMTFPYGASRVRAVMTLTPSAGAQTTIAKVSNSPATTSGLLSQAIDLPIGTQTWDLSNPTTGGSASTGLRTVYVQWGDGAGHWSAVSSSTVAFVQGATYFPLTPTRILDTRSGIGMSGVLMSRVARTFQVTGIAGVPANAIAVTGNLTVTQQQGLGYLYLGPTAMNNPTSSTLNFPMGDDRANNLTVALGSAGTLSVTYAANNASYSTQAVFDVTGYFAASGAGATYVPLTPNRILDTRYGTGLSGALASHVARTFQVAGQGDVPADATAVTGNLTVTQQTSRGFLYLGPNAINDPTSSTLNFPLADDRANGVVVALSGTGSLSVTYAAPSTSATAQGIFDVTGYFVPNAAGLTYVPLAPVRILDTRSNLGLSGGLTSHVARTFAVAGMGGAASFATAVTGNLTVTKQTSLGFLYLGPDPLDYPTSSTLNFPVGDNRANGVNVALGGTGDLSITYASSSPSATTQVIFDLTGYFRP